MYRVSGAVEVPGPPLLRASRLSKTLSVALRLKMIDDSRIGSDSGTMMWRTSRKPLAPSSRADSMISSGMSSRPA